MALLAVRTDPVFHLPETLGHHAALAQPAPALNNAVSVPGHALFPINM